MGREAGSSEATTQRDELVERALAMPAWYHSIDLGHGVVTPGVWPEDSQQHVVKALDGIDFTGAKVLDVGCLDGRWTFEAERRGATQVYSIDLISQAVDSARPQYFDIAAQVMGSTAHYNPHLSVHDVAKLGVDDFDVVLFLGVYYHLKDPLLALARLRKVMRDGGAIVVEGQVIHDDVSFARFFFNQSFSSDQTNWWIPSTACLREWVECSFFDVEWEYALPPVTWDRIDGTARAVLRARAVRRADPRMSAPDLELHAFDQNRYG